MSRPAPWVSAVVAQAVVEVRSTARRGENLLAMIGIPVAVLLFVAVVGGGGAMDARMPGMLAIAIVASGLVNLAITTAYERGYGVMKRLGGSPLGRGGLVAAKLGVVLGIGVVQVAGLLAGAWLLGWRWGPDASLVAVALATVLGTAAFAGLGLAIAGALRPEAALVIVNVLFLVAIGFGGAVVPLGELPPPVALIARALPVGALTEGFGAALGSGAALAAPLTVLAVWALGAVILATRSFRWE